MLKNVLIFIFVLLCFLGFGMLGCGLLRRGGTRKLMLGKGVIFCFREVLSACGSSRPLPSPLNRQRKILYSMLQDASSCKPAPFLLPTTSIFIALCSAKQELTHLK